MHCSKRVLAFFLSLFLALFQSSAAVPKRPSTLLSMAKAQGSKESAVLAELKATIKDQVSEIKSLKAQLQSAGRASGGAVSHGHGGGEPNPEDVARYLTTPFYRQALSRVGWLGLFLCSLSMTALIMNGFEHTLEKNIELAYFVPMLAGHGGNTGGQTVGTILSALSSGSIKPSDAGSVIRKEALTGLMSGIILSSGVSVIAHYVMGISLHVSTVLLFALPVVSTIAATLGSSIPFVCVLLGLDPSVIAAPAMTSFVDVSGLMSYFLIANQVFQLFGLEL